MDVVVLNCWVTATNETDWASKAGTGAYIIEEFNPGVRSLLKLNPNRWDQAAGYVDSAELLHVTRIVDGFGGAIGSGALPQSPGQPIAFDVSIDTLCTAPD
jgi:ABC-type transport system substrate-binding protein